MRTSPKSNVIIGRLRRSGILRTRDLIALGVTKEYLRKLVRNGIIENVSRGLYRLPNADVSIHHSIAVACKQVPSGVICLLSALRFHNVTTQNPTAVWIAIGRETRQPTISTVPMRFVKSSSKFISTGVERHRTADGPVRVYSLARTIADCFKFRNKIGIDVAVEALQSALRNHKVDIDELWKYAKLNRISKIITPYLTVIE